MIKYIYPDGSYVYVSLYATEAVLRDEKGRLLARIKKHDGTLHEFEIKAFQILEVGEWYS